MNLKKVNVLPLLAVIVGVFVLTGTASAADMEWDGSGTGVIDHRVLPFDPWVIWHMDFTVFDAVYYSVDGQWNDLNGHTGDIWGYANRSTGAGSGNWGVDNSVPPYTGTWSGTFDFNSEICSGTWSCSAGNGTWYGTQTYP